MSKSIQFKKTVRFGVRSPDSAAEHHIKYCRCNRCTAEFATLRYSTQQILWVNNMSVLYKLHLINSQHWSLLHELNVKEPYYFTMCGFSHDANFCLDGKANKMCTSGL